MASNLECWFSCDAGASWRELENFVAAVKKRERLVEDLCWIRVSPAMMAGYFALEPRLRTGSARVRKPDQPGSNQS
jgi:hypothetical protein